ncbi:MAG: endo alpha-1,4 polygalactosaminidase [Propioniciclava sp.]
MNRNDLQPSPPRRRQFGACLLVLVALVLGLTTAWSRPVWASVSESASYTRIYSPNVNANATLDACIDATDPTLKKLQLRYVGDDSPFLRLTTVFNPRRLSRHTQSLQTYVANWTWEGEYSIPSRATKVRSVLTFDDNTRDIVNTSLDDIMRCMDEPKPTDPPTEPPTTEPPTTGPQIARLTPGTSWDWIISGKPSTVHLDASANSKKMIDVDLEDTSAQTIAAFKQRGITVVCYFSAGSYEDWRSDAASIPAAALGRSNGWPGERWLDIRNPAVLAIMESRMDIAAAKGCHGVEPDNVDGYTNRTGFPLTAADQRAFNKALAAAAHERGLAIGLKNDIEQVAELEPYFDFAVNEQCNQYNECGVYSAFTDNNKAVFNAEYDTSNLRCGEMNAANIDSVLFSMDLDGSRYRTCR